MLQEELSAQEPSLIISRAPCVLKEKKAIGKPHAIDPQTCKNCRACLKLGCPAIEAAAKRTKPAINPQLCTGCTLCAQVCRFGAISS